MLTSTFRVVLALSYLQLDDKGLVLTNFQHIQGSTKGLTWITRVPDQNFKVKVTSVRPKIKSRSNYDVVKLHSLTNVTTKYQLYTYGF